MQPHGYGEQHVDAAFAEFYAARNEVECYSDALPALESMAALYPLVSLSNGNADLERIGLARFFHFSISSRSFGKAKPAAEIFHAACAGLDLPPSEVLHIGDDPALDVLGAHAAGLRSAWLNRSGAAWDHAVRPDMVARDLSEVATMLERTQAVA
jgi:putative hydrolase of the HAD superfamily